MVEELDGIADTVLRMILSKQEKRQVHRQMLWDILHNGRGRAGALFQMTLITLILLSSALIPIEFIIRQGASHVAITTLEAVIVGLFTAEYALRLYASPKRLRYVFSFFGIIDLLSILPFYVNIFGSPFIRLIRLVRLFKLGQIEAAAEMANMDDMRKDMGLVEGEIVEYVVSKSPITLIIGIIAPLFALTFGLGILFQGEGVIAIATSVGLILFALVFLWKAWLDFSYDVIYVTNYRLIFQNQHLLGRSINQVNYSAITNVKPRYPNPLSYILRFGSIVIDTAAENPGQIAMHMIRRHEKAAQIIMQKTMAATIAKSINA